MGRCRIHSAAAAITRGHGRATRRLRARGGDSRGGLVARGSAQAMSRNARVPRPSLAVTGVGAVLCVVGIFLDPARTAAAYLVAYMSCLAVALGNLAMIKIGRAHV